MLSWRRRTAPCPALRAPSNPPFPAMTDDSARDRARHERQLMARVQAGDEAALGELYDRFAATLNALAFRVLRRDGAAEEVVQEVFLHAWKRAATYDPARSSVATWLVLLTRSRAIDRLRSRKVVDRTHDHVRRDSSSHESPEGPGRVQGMDRRRRIRGELANLPDEQRQVLELAYYRGLTQREIADATGTPLGTVKTRTLLALRKLRAALREELEDLL